MFKGRDYMYYSYGYKLILPLSGMEIIGRWIAVVNTKNLFYFEIGSH